MAYRRPRDGKKSYWRAPLPSLLSSASDRRSCRSALRWVHLWATISGRRKIHEHDPGIIIFLFLLQVQRFIQWVAVSHESRLLSSVSHAPHTDCLEIICQRYANDWYEQLTLFSSNVVLHLRMATERCKPIELAYMCAVHGSAGTDKKRHS